MTSSPATLQHVCGARKEARAKFAWWSDRIKPILELPRGQISAALKILASDAEVSFKTVERYYLRAKKEGLSGLLDRRLAGSGYWLTTVRVTLCIEDRELVKLYCEANGRSSKAGVKQLRRDYAKGLRNQPGILKEVIKTKTPVDPRTRMPRGWSTRNLLRYAPSRFELKNSRQGSVAAKSERPLVYTTRANLYVGAVVQIDDLEHDFFINTFQENQAGRPLELFSHDLFSARKCHWGIRVKTVKDDGTANKLTERMTRYIIAAHFALTGYSPRGTVLVAEHGTAAVRENIEKALLDHSGGLITVRRSGMQGAAPHAGQYPGISRGNPNAKASLESSNNLTHNAFGPLPGQTGPDNKRRPAQLAALLDHNEKLLIARRYLSPESQALLQFPLLELNEYMAIAHEQYAAIENDDDHELEGWIQAGNTVKEVLLGDTWIDQRKLMHDPAQCELVLTLLGSGQVQTRPRKMTRWEAFQSGASDLVKIPGYGICSILGDDLAKERKVRSNMFAFEDQEVGPGDHRFDAVAIDPQGRRTRLKDREKYLAFINPFAPDSLYVQDAAGSYIGECRRITVADPADVATVQRAMGAAIKTENELLAPLKLRHLREARQKAAMHMSNTELLRAAGVGDGSPSRPLRSSAPTGEAENWEPLPADLQPQPTQPETETW